MSVQKIIFIEHAREQISDRNIELSTIESAINQPDYVLRQSDNRFRLIKIISSAPRPRLIVIVYEQHKSHKEIITAFYTSKVNKYL